MQSFFDTIGDMTVKTTQGERFRAFRTHLGLAGQAVAEPLGVTKTAISYWESGRVSLSRTACLLAERIYRISSSWLLDGEGPMWLPVTIPNLQTAPGVLLRPLLYEVGAFNEAGEVIHPGENALYLGLPRSLLESILASCCGGGVDDLFFTRIRDRLMEPTLLPEDWVLLHTGIQRRLPVEDQALYLVRLRQEDEPLVRRVALEPRSGDYLIGVDTQGQIPLRVTISEKDLASVFLGKVCWLGGQR